MPSRLDWLAFVLALLLASSICFSLSIQTGAEGALSLPQLLDSAQQSIDTGQYEQAVPIQFVSGLEPQILVVFHGVQFDYRLIQRFSSLY